MTGEKRREMLPGRKAAPVRLGRVLVLGLGKSGRAAADYLIPLIGTRVDALAVAAGAPNDDALAWAEEARARGAVVAFDHEAIEGSYDLCVASPGISERSAFYRSAAAASAEVVSEVELAWRESAADARWVAVTGTNGKTTTTSLIAHVLRGAGMDAVAVGNIGDTCIGAVGAGGAAVYVAETSSYQLASTRDFAPDVAVVLNITPDHLAWHGSHEAYAAAKWKVLANLARTPGAVAVLDAVDDAVRERVRALRAQDPAERGFAYVPLGTARGLGFDMRAACGSDNAAFVAPDGTLTVALGAEERRLCRVDDLKVRGDHNVANALAAASAALALGAPADAVAAHLASFARAPHRALRGRGGRRVLQRLQGHQRRRHPGGAHRLPGPAPHGAPRRPRQGHRPGAARGCLRGERLGRGVLRRGPRALPRRLQGCRRAPGAGGAGPGGRPGRGPAAPCPLAGPGHPGPWELWPAHVPPVRPEHPPSGRDAL